jgi:hypothetical protein
LSRARRGSQPCGIINPSNMMEGKIIRSESCSTQQVKISTSNA